MTKPTFDPDPFKKPGRASNQNRRQLGRLADDVKQVNRRFWRLPANKRYMPPPPPGAGATGLDARMRSEVVLTFEPRPHFAGQTNATFSRRDHI